MKVFWLLGQLAFALKIFPAPLKPSKFYQMNLGRMNVVQHILHHLDLSRSLQELLRVLANPAWPFDEVYDLGCVLHMSEGRMREIKAALLFECVEMGMDHGWVSKAISLLLSSSCLAGITGVRKLRASDINWLGPGYLFRSFPPTSDPLPVLQPSTFLSQLRLTIDEDASFGVPAPLQSCQSWLFSAGTPREIYNLPLSSLFGSSSAWMAIHPICYQSKHHLSHHIDTRLGKTIQQLVDERPIDTLVPVNDDSDLARWSLHLILIMFNFANHIDTMGGSVSAPIRNYLKLLAKSLPNDSVLCELLLAAEKLWVQHRLETFMMRTSQDNIPSFPDFSALQVLLHGSLHPVHHPTWTLQLMMLYGRNAEDPFWKAPEIRFQFCLGLREVTPMEQFHWIKVILGKPEEFSWAIPTISRIVRSNKALQLRLLEVYQEVLLRQKYPVQFKFLTENIPFKTRLKALRAWFIKDWRNIKRLRLMASSQLATHHDVPAFIRLYCNRQRHFFSMPRPCQDTMCQVKLLKPQWMEKVANILSIAILHDIKLPWPLCPYQASVLFGFHGDKAQDISSHIMSKVFREVDGPLVQEIDWEAPRLKYGLHEFMEVARSILPPFFTWPEFQTLLGQL